MNLNTSKYSFPHVLAIFIATFLLYGNSIWNDYSGDDCIVINENSFTLQGFKGIKDIITSDGVLDGWMKKENSSAEKEGFRKRYRPLSQLSFAVEIQFFGQNPHFSHFVNVFLYAIIGILIFILLLKINPNQATRYLSFPFIAAVIFIAHPVHTEAVSNIKSRDEILAMLFALCSLLFCLKYFETDKFKFIFSAVLCFFLSLLSKENAVTFLVVVPLFIYYIYPSAQDKSNNTFYKHLSVFIPLTGIIVLYYVLSSLVIGQNNPSWTNDILNNHFYKCTFVQKFGTIFYSLGKDLQLLIFPYRLLCDYSIFQIQIHDLFEIIPIVSILIYTAIFIYAFINIKSRNIPGLAIIYYLATMSVYSNLFVLTGVAVAERFLFMPSLGFAIILSYIITVKLQELITHKQVKKVIVPVIVILIITSYSCLVLPRNKEWKNLNSILKADVDKPNNCARLNFNYAKLMFDGTMGNGSGFIDSVRTAKCYYLKSVKIYPEFRDALNLLAYCYYIAYKDYDSTVYYYLKSLKVNSDQEQLYKNIINVLNIKNDNAYSQKTIRQLIELNPDQAMLYYYLGKTYQKLEMIDSAIFYVDKAIKMNPAYTKAVDDLIVILKNLDFKKYDMAEVYNRLGEIYLENKNDYTVSISYFVKATQLNSKFSQAYYNLGITYYIIDQKDKAVNALENANKFSPGNLTILSKLCSLYKELGDNKNFIKYSRLMVQGK
jgi:protein O-mannosyl-transferase